MRNWKCGDCFATDGSRVKFRRQVPFQNFMLDFICFYAALSPMVEEAGYSIEENDLPAIAREIAVLNATVASKFSRGPVLVQERDEIEKKNRSR